MAFRDRTPGLTMLLYHGVTASRSRGIENFSRKHIHADEFDRQMKFLRDECAVLSIDEVVDLRERGRPYPPRSVAVTFDDGFKNNAAVAAPILRDHGVPAVFYVTAGMVNTDLMFWVDKVEDCINLTEKSDITVQLQQPRKFSLSDDAEKIEAITEIKKFCKSVEDTRKNQVLSDLIEQTGVLPSVAHADNYQKLGWKELIAMHEDPLFTIGGHSMYHSILANLEPREMERDVNLSIGLLEYHLKDKLTHYAYPEGQAEHYNDRVVDHLKKQGIVCSPSAIYGFNGAEIGLFDLRRIMVGFMDEPFPFDPEYEEALS